MEKYEMIDCCIRYNNKDNAYDCEVYGYFPSGKFVPLYSISRLNIESCLERYHETLEKYFG